jgi:mannose/cellobiose epimerase-like protein (N-acyl-D-glucosamine 2-epimerase family)
MTDRGARGFSDMLAGRVSALTADGFELAAIDGCRHRIEVNDLTAAEFLRNLGEPYVDASGHLREMLRPGRHLFVQGVVYPADAGSFMDAKRLVFLGRGMDDFNFEEPTWWIRQVDELAAFYRRAQFGTNPVDYHDYRTVLRLGGEKTDSHVQETDTISRMVYGMATAYLLTGKDEYLDVAERGVEYLRQHMRFVDREEGIVYWYHGISVNGEHETKLFTSEFGDDYDAVPMYEQIYALAGPVQTYRVTGDPLILDDAEQTLALFERYFRDHERGGYFSHIDPILLSAHHESLGPNRARKNWNSIGDHAPAYLINLFLATGDRRHADMLERTFDMVVDRFPEHSTPPASPFVQERFHADWSPDITHSWQQNRAVVGHNLKIVWNLMRMHSLRPKQRYRELAEHIGHSMPAVGADRQRGGWYDTVERLLRPGEIRHRFAWHDRKAWWQQEQAILAYLLLAGTTGDGEFLAEARSAAAFYNAFFLDHDAGGVYFNVLAEGFPYLLGLERLKGSHSMSMYHSTELGYLATVYTTLLVHRRPLNLWFKPLPHGFENRILRVQPDLLPPGSVELVDVEIDGYPYEKFDRAALTVELPPSRVRQTVRARIMPVDGSDQTWK